MNVRQLVRGGVIVGVLAGAIAAVAQNAPARVMVIFDTSKSMLELPDGGLDPVTGDLAKVQDNVGLGGDYDPSILAGNMACQNKFCAAKKAVFNTLPSYTVLSPSNPLPVEIGFATYNQYIMRRRAAAQTTCQYDVLLPAGLPRSFGPTASDIVGDGPVIGSTKANVFPENLTTTCLNNGDTQYTVRKVGYSNAGMQYSCTVNNGTTSLPVLGSTLTSNVCGTMPNVNSVWFEAVGSVQNNFGPINLSNGMSPTCSAVGPRTSNIPALSGGQALKCSAGAPCALTLSSTTATTTNGTNVWYLFQNPQNIINPALVPTGKTHSWLPAASQSGVATLTGAVLMNQTACQPTGFYSGAPGAVKLSQFGISATNLTSNLTLMAGRPTPFIADDTPGRIAGPPVDYDCQPNTPCYITNTMSTSVMQPATVFRTDFTMIPLVAPVPAPDMPAPAGSMYSAAVMPPDTFTLVQANGMGTTCPVLGPSTVSPVPAPANFNWQAGAPTGCGAGRLQCTFTAPVQNTIGSGCGPQTFYVSGSMPSPAVCAVNGSPYTGGAITNPALPSSPVMLASATCPGTAAFSTVTNPTYTTCPGGVSTCSVMLTGSSMAMATGTTRTTTSSPPAPADPTWYQVGTAGPMGSSGTTPVLSGFQYNNSTPPMGFSGMPSSATMQTSSSGSASPPNATWLANGSTTTSLTSTGAAPGAPAGFAGLTATTSSTSSSVAGPNVACGTATTVTNTPPMGCFAAATPSTMSGATVLNGAGQYGLAPNCAAVAAAAPAAACGGAAGCSVQSTVVVDPAGRTDCGPEGSYGICRACSFTHPIYNWSKSTTVTTVTTTYTWTRYDFKRTEYRWTRNDPYWDWARPQKVCNYVGYQQTFTATNPNIITCTYQRPKYNVMQPTAPKFNCQYSVPVQEFRYTGISSSYCSYTTTRTTLTGYASRTYNYSYLTKGGEIAGQVARPFVGTAFCPSSGPAAIYSITPAPNAFANACPETIPCTSTGPGEICPSCPAGATCSARLKYTDTFANLRYANKQNGQNVVANSECMLSTSNLPPASPNMYISRFCGSSSISLIYKLISDWYSDGVPQADNDLVAATTFQNTLTMGTGVWDWSKTWPKKDYGWSGATNDAGMNSLVFLPPASGAGQQQALQRAMGPCVRPSVANGNMLGLEWDAGGVCLADEADSNLTVDRPKPPAPELGFNAGSAWSARMDFTPLYGSLKNVAAYYAAMPDDSVACRKYFTVLATDGNENTPANKSTSDLVQAVTDLRSVSRPDGTIIDVKTYVIGFGAITGGTGALNSMAAAGGTTAAYTAASTAELQAALDAIFNDINSGTYIRAKPSVSTDGKRMYVGTFTQGGGAEVPGEFRAYDLATGAQKWEASTKINAQSEASRVLKVRVAGATVDFDATEPTLLAAIGATPGIPIPTARLPNAATVVNFIRNAGVPSLSYANFIGPPAPRLPEQRRSRFGGLIHSGSVVVGKSPFAAGYAGLNGAEQAAYNLYLAATNLRPTRVFVPNNDGMIRGITENSSDPACLANEAGLGCPNGEEAFGFVPESAIQGLWKQMQNGANITVDGVPVASDVCIAGGGRAENCNATDWKTAVITGMRGGGTSYVALDATNTAAAPQFMWEFNHNRLGFTIGGASVGRVKVAGHDKYVSLFGGGVPYNGGRCAQPTGETVQANCTPTVGKAVFAVDMADGTNNTDGCGGAPGCGSPFTEYRRGSSTHNIQDEFVTRPAIFRRPGPDADTSKYLDQALLAGGSSLYVMRFADPSGVQHNNVNKWKPDEFFNPLSTRNRDDSLGQPLKIRKVQQLTPGDPVAGIPPTFGLVTPPAPFDTQLPLSNAPVILNRPKIASIRDVSGFLPDYFVGTGNALTPGDSVPYWDNNPQYFYAIHDTNAQTTGGTNDGVGMWINRFLDLDCPDSTPSANGGTCIREGVVSEPAIITGCVVVVTYKRADGSSNTCNPSGSTKVYGFDPRTGDLANCLVYPSTGPGSGAPSSLPDGGTATTDGGTGGYAGQSTSVLDLGDPGIPTDLVVVDGIANLPTSKGGVLTFGVISPVASGDLRSTNRIK